MPSIKMRIASEGGSGAVVESLMPRPGICVRLLCATLALAACVVAGCRKHHEAALCPSPAQMGYNTRDLIDVAAQKEQDELTPPNQLLAVAERLRNERQE